MITTSPRLQSLLHGDEDVVYPSKCRAFPDTPGGRLQDLIETAKVHVRAKVEHPFRLIKPQFGFYETRLRGLAKNICKINVIVALMNLFLASRRLLATA
jgi:transposase, IS5 family